MSSSEVLLKRPPYGMVNRVVTIGAYELMCSLLDSGNPLELIAFSELAASAHDINYRLSDISIANILVDDQLIIRVTDDGRLIISPMMRAIVMASTTPGEVGYNLLPLTEVID